MNLVCDACGQPVRFSDPGRTYEHTRLTTCTGIDGIVLGVYVAEPQCVVAVNDQGAAQGEY